jgi:hypothetical protein
MFSRWKKKVASLTASENAVAPNGQRCANCEASMGFKGPLRHFRRIHEYECAPCGLVVLCKVGKMDSPVIVHLLEAAE